VESVPPTEEVIVAEATDTLREGLRQRLGVTDAEASDEVLLAALNESLEEAAEPAATALPEGVTTIEAAQLEELRAAAEMGRQAHERQAREDRERLVASAVEDGRIAPARREHWLKALASDPGAAETLASLEKGLIPVSPIGHDGGIESQQQDFSAFAAFDAMLGLPTSKEA
jgi:hypothetical protein